MSDHEKKIEARGYAKGYAAGKKRKLSDIKSTHVQSAKAAFYNRAYLAALPALIISSPWYRGEKKLGDVPGRSEMADEFAREALKYWRCP